MQYRETTLEPPVDEPMPARGHSSPAASATVPETAIGALERLCAARARGRCPRTLVACAHPDDETVGMGARLASLSDVALVYATDGTPCDLRDALAHGYAQRDAYAQARRRERAEALALAGVDVTRIVDVGLVEQEATLSLVPLTLRLETMFALVRPEVVVTHAYEGGHPDHDATAFAVHAAVARLAARGRSVPTVLEMTAHHGRGDAIVAGAFLGEDAVGDGEPGDAARTRSVELNPTVRALKRRMLACYVTQQRTLSALPVRRERFRVAPRYDFTRPPHEGPSWYERTPGTRITAAQWRAHAAAALERLDLARGA